MHKIEFRCTLTAAKVRMIHLIYIIVWIALNGHYYIQFPKMSVQLALQRHRFEYQKGSMRDFTSRMRLIILEIIKEEYSKINQIKCVGLIRF